MQARLARQHRRGPHRFALALDAEQDLVERSALAEGSDGAVDVRVRRPGARGEKQIDARQNRLAAEAVKVWPIDVK